MIAIPKDSKRLRPRRAMVAIVSAWRFDGAVRALS